MISYVIAILCALVLITRPIEGTWSFRKRQCMPGSSAQACNLNFLDSQLNAKEFLASDASPGKRNFADKDPARRLLQLLISSSQTLPQPKKRTCQIRGGGHCILEMADRAMKWNEYLKSSDSPGRRRRSTRRSRKLKAVNRK